MGAGVVGAGGDAFLTGVVVWFRFRGACQVAIASKPAPTGFALIEEIEHDTCPCRSWLAGDGVLAVDTRLEAPIAGKPGSYRFCVGQRIRALFSGHKKTAYLSVSRF
jgi:hypothetical protein